MRGQFSPPSPDQAIFLTMTREQGRIVSISSNSSLIDHFLRKIRLSCSYHTWVNYAYDLKQFFALICKPLEAIDRRDCVLFLEQLDSLGYARTTINRRLAAVSSLFHELNLLDPIQFARNPVNPLRRDCTRRARSHSLYRSQPQRIPDVVADPDVQAFLQALPTWRDRTLLLLMWISCLRISEAVAIRFQDIECAHRSIQIAHGKGGQPRTVYMDRATFAALNTYLDQERKNLFPEVDEVFVAFKGVARGRPLSVNALQHTIDYYAQKCGLSYLHAHLFRHTGITCLVQHGMPEAALRKLVGHTHANSLTPYLHLGDGFVEREFAKAQEVFQPSSLLELPRTGGV
jgi:site-specific recombinase XerD